MMQDRLPLSAELADMDLEKVAAGKDNNVVVAHRGPVGHGPVGHGGIAAGGFFAARGGFFFRGF
jgi:hypothetical protein